MMSLNPNDWHLIRRANKRPVDKDWPKLTNQQYNDHRALQGEVGLVCGDIMVLDIDVDKATGEIRPDTIVALMALDLPPTLKVQTPSGGWHYFFHNDGGQVLPRRIGVAPGIDWLGNGGYVALYEPLSQYEPDDMNGIPASIIELLSKPKPTTDDLAIKEGSRNDSLYRYGCGLAGQGMGREEIWQAINAENMRYLPPLDMTEVRQIFGQIEAHIKEPEPDVQIDVLGHTPAEVLNLKLPAIESICGPLMGGTITTLHGESGAGKSLFALHMGLHIAAGLDFESWRVKMPKSVLYLDQENPSTYVQQRMMSLDTQGRFRIVHRKWLSEHGLRLNLSQEKHQALVLQHRPDVLVIDSLMALNPPTDDASMNSAEWFERLMQFFDKITDKGGAVFILGNLNKQKKMYGTEAQVWRSDRNWTAEKWEQTDERFSTGLHFDGGKERGLEEKEVKSKWRFSLKSGWIEGE